MNAHGDLKNINANNLAECHETIRNIIHTVVTTIFILGGILQVHFCRVVYSHWKDHSAAVDEVEIRHLHGE